MLRQNKEQQQTKENCVSVTIRTRSPNVELIKAHRMRRAGRGTHTRDEKCIQNFKTGNPMGRNHSGHAGEGVCKLRSAGHHEHFNSARGNMQMFLRIRP